MQTSLLSEVAIFSIFRFFFNYGRFSTQNRSKIDQFGFFPTNDMQTLQFLWKIRHVLNRMKNQFYDFYFSSYLENLPKVAVILSTKMTITRKIKICFFLSIQLISCKFYIFSKVFKITWKIGNVLKRKKNQKSCGHFCTRDHPNFRWIFMILEK